MLFSFSIHASSQKSSARTGTFVTAHGEIQTPVFMPVGTKGAIKGLSWEEMEEMGVDIVLGNTYHLYLRPGDQLIADLGGLHKFGGWKKSILTDSGGFQVFSLGAGKREGIGKPEKLVKITEEGVEFKSYLDGSTHFFSPERVMEIEGNIGGDIAMAFDECAPHDADRKYLEASMNMTHRWAERSLAAFQKVQKEREMRMGSDYYPQVLFPIVQGGIEEDFRKESAKFIADLGQPGNAIGGLSVGESKEDMYRIMDIVDGVLPKDKPRYLMGVGTPEDLLEGVARGIDMFDCVLPTRLGRHGAFFSHDGRKTITNEKYTRDLLPLDPDCTCRMCQTHSRAYIRHLFNENEIMALRILSYHNVFFLVDLMKKSREKIREGTFDSWKEEFLKRYFAK